MEAFLQVKYKLSWFLSLGISRPEEYSLNFYAGEFIKLIFICLPRLWDLLQALKIFIENLEGPDMYYKLQNKSEHN